MTYPSWHILPTELWLVIFDLIESAKELANCRLVCKRWSALAEAAMLGQNLKFDTVESISKFNSQLKMKPQMARLIKSIHLPYTDDLNLPLQKELLDLALTPNIKHFQGQMSEEILIHFLEIAQRSSSKFDRLQVLPELYTMDNKYVDTMLYFKDSLREISVSVLPFEMPESSQCIATHLREFRSLTKLTLDLYGLPCSNDEPTNFIELEKILNRCKHLEVLEFTWGSVVNSSMGTAEFKKWLSNNVQQVSSLYAFKVGKLEGPHMLEYLVYKYPNVSKASITYLESCSKRIIDAVKNIETVELIIPNTLGIEELKEGITNAEEFKNLILAMKSTTNQVQIQQSSSFDSFGQGLLEITKCIKTRNTKFSIPIQGHVRPICKDIISIIGSVHHLETNYVGFADYYQAEDSILERLRYIIPFDSLDKLTSLKFLCHEEISKEISEEIAKYAPNLKHLTINTCCSYN
ncbi:hypothetical protein [Parasitella parasitica]|uniref:F-box domain-containing protein n=1 Tax=Parasitella parasitica TaxID=35722 RepID=A0A0B7MWQ3_9FUNG|nr:hypothetical protein [Parasitella parasitica]